MIHGALAGGGAGGGESAVSLEALEMIFDECDLDER